MQRFIRTALPLAILTAFATGPTPAQTGYRVPPAPIPEILDAPPLPYGSPGPDGDSLLLAERANLQPISDVDLRGAGSG